LAHRPKALAHKFKALVNEARTLGRRRTTWAWTTWVCRPTMADRRRAVPARRQRAASMNAPFPAKDSNPLRFPDRSVAARVPGPHPHALRVGQPSTFQTFTTLSGRRAHPRNRANVRPAPIAGPFDPAHRPAFERLRPASRCRPTPSAHRQVASKPIICTRS
jgi:hypothetical protein